MLSLKTRIVKGAFVSFAAVMGFLEFSTDMVDEELVQHG